MFAVQIVLFLGKAPPPTPSEEYDGLHKSISSPTDSLGKYSRMTTGSVSSTRSEGCVEEGGISAV